MRTARVRGCAVLAVLAVIVVLAGLQRRGVETVVEAASQPAQPAQDEFVPMESVPPEDQLPAAALLVAAYALLWLAVIGYLWSIWLRMSTVEQELSALSRRTGES